MLHVIQLIFNCDLLRKITFYALNLPNLSRPMMLYAFFFKNLSLLYIALLFKMTAAFFLKYITSKSTNCTIVRLASLRVKKAKEVV